MAQSSISPSEECREGGKLEKQPPTRRQIYTAFRKLETRRKLLSAARQLFAEQGYARTGPTDIARQAGVGVGTFYLHFEDKLDCFLAFTNAAVEELVDLQREYLAQAHNFPEMINAIVRSGFDYSQLNPGVYTAMAANFKFLSAENKKPVFRQTAYFVNQIDKWKELGGVDKSLNSKLVARLIAGAITEAVLTWHQYSKKDIVADNVTLFLIRGISKRPDIDQLTDHISDATVPQVAKFLKDSDLSLDGRSAGPNRPTTKADETRHRLLLAAKALFSANGYHEVSADDIATKAGTSIGTFYIYFEHKFDCFLAFTDQAARELHEFTGHKLRTATSFPEKIDRLLSAHLDYAAENPGVMKAVFADTGVLEKNRRGHVPRGVDGIVERIEKWKQDGEVVDDFDSLLLANLMIGFIKEAEVFLLHYPQKRKQTIDSIRRIILCAISTRMAVAQLN